ncbi:tryptophan halogenase family protein [Pseudoalteromonas ruthenica]|uniref:tryptophan halogenase family protein n=1 Tax=Pseudoalteromonas ruthenica TaxID=151081 RepID=UPI0024200734|nr:tryptophan halogenase family protein [Pseudoalteromonas ruthenica]|tara:strand:- start:13926 stop:15473 length:1548 start_codon:yes stop_codon:yes gene_type:complete
MKDLSRVIVVGGGTSGWLSAAYLASSFKRTGRDIKVSIIESDTIPTIGVGEGTFPTIVNTLYEIGLSEKEFITACDASFKQGALFKNWLYNPSDKPHAYYHPFDPPAKPKGLDLSAYWVSRKHQGTMQQDFAHATSVQSFLCDENLAPKTPETGEYAWLAKYAYHLDAAKLGQLLKKHAMNKLQVEHIVADIEQVELDEQSFIAHLVDKQQRQHDADFFVDCTGFSSLLLAKALNVPFVDKSHYLTVDTAVVLPVEYADAETPITTHTVSTAQDAGWIWDIALQNRRGTGYVYNSHYCSKEQAEKTLCDYHGIAHDSEKRYRHISFKTGYREKSWAKNCCAIGFSSGFVEPLEATAIAMVEAGVRSLAARFPATREAMLEREKQYNRIFTSRWDNIIDFIKLHYCLTKRDDTPFWREQKDPKTIPASLQEKLKAWQHYGITDGDLPYKYDLFTLASWQYILYGLEFLPDYVEKAPINEEIIDKAFASIAAQKRSAASKLLSNRALLEAFSASYKS